MTIPFVPCLVGGQWEVWLPDFRKKFHEDRGGRWEIGRLEDMARRVEPGMVVWDVGAEHGDFTALYRSWTGAEVVPVEPSPGYWPCIRQTFEANGFSSPAFWFQGFVADHTKRKPHDLGRNGWPGYSNGAITEDFGFRHLAQQSAMYSCITIDDLALETIEPDVLVIDIEGAEFRAMRGATETLRSRSVLTYVSVHRDTMSNWYGDTPEEMDAYMDGLGYDVQVLPENGEGELFYLYTKRS